MAAFFAASKANYASKGVEIPFLWHQWAFTRQSDLPADTARDLAQASRESSANLRFLKCLAKKTAEGVNVSHSLSAGNYAAKVLSAMPTAKGYSRREFEGAMQRLLELGMIKANENVFQYPNRTWANGLAVVSVSARKVAQNIAQTAAQESTGDLFCDLEICRNDCTEVHETEGPSTTYMLELPLRVRRAQVGRQGLPSLTIIN